MDTDLVAAARAAASRAADRAGVRITDVHDLDGIHRVAELFDAVWGRDADAGRAMSPELLRAMTHAGNQVTAAWLGDDMVAATAALIGWEDGQAHLHSHITGVVPSAQARGVGWAMKQYQRSWCLDRGLHRVRWTFDPLIRRNAVFNLVKLGARPIAYRHDEYGRMQDALNRGLPTDRVVAEWSLDERRVAMAAEGRFAEPRLDALRGAGAMEILRDEDGEPVTTAADGRQLLAQVPADMEAIRADDLPRAERWAEAVRATLGARIRAGYRVTGFTRDGWYVLARDERLEELA